MPLRQILSRHWFRFQRELFPWLEEVVGPLGERYERLVRVLELVGVEESLPYSKRRRGRPRKGERQAKEPRRLERQAAMTLEEMLKDLPKVCDIGVKLNAKGHQESWIGYKLHLDTIDGGIPVSCLLTSASVHDSQAAIPLARLTARRVTSLYDLSAAACHGREPAATPHQTAGTERGLEHGLRLRSDSERETLSGTNPSLTWLPITRLLSTGYKGRNPQVALQTR